MRCLSYGHFLAILTAFTLGCNGGLFDDEPCGPDQHLDLDLCMCNEGFAPAADGPGCAPCGDNELSAGDVCVCAPGFFREPASGVCEEMPAGLGAECDPAGTPCTAPHTLCQADEHTGYCTSTCVTADDCDGGWRCAADGFCERPPSGLLDACSDHDDCAGNQADYCESVQLHQCIVSKCTLSPDNCYGGWECCDLSSFGLEDTLCLPEGSCPTG